MSAKRDIKFIEGYTIQREIDLEAHKMYEKIVGKDCALRRRVCKGLPYSPDEVRNLYLDCVRIQEIFKEMDTTRGTWPHKVGEIKEVCDYWEGVCKDIGLSVSKRDIFEF